MTDFCTFFKDYVLNENLLEMRLESRGNEKKLISKPFNMVVNLDRESLLQTFTWGSLIKSVYIDNPY